MEIYKRLRPGEPPTIDAAKEFFNRLFFDSETYDLSEVGRLKSVSYTHLRAHETVLDLVCRLLLEKTKTKQKKKTKQNTNIVKTDHNNPLEIMILHRIT